MERLFGLVAVVGGMLGAAALFFAVFAILRGFVFSTLWNWFVIPALGAPHLGIGLAIGLGLIVSFFTANLASEKSADGKHNWMAGVMSPLMALLIGFILHSVFSVGV